MLHDENTATLEQQKHHDSDSCETDWEGIAGLVDAYAEVLAEIDSRCCQPTL